MPGPNFNLQLSTTGLAMLQAFEGLRLQAYRDVRGILTIGYGHTGPDVVPSLSWTAAQATTALEEDVMYASKAIQDTVQVELAQNQFDPLVTFAYNVGITAFKNSTLLVLLNNGDYAGAGEQFNKWIYADSIISSGLVKRRQIESNMFLGVAA